MNAVRKTLLGAAIAAISMNASALTVNPTNDGSTLVNTILGAGVTISPGSINYVGGNGQAGTFTGGLASGLGIDSGIVLTTGLATDAAGPNSSDNTSVDSGTGGDAYLQSLVGGTLYNANVLEFQFESTGGDLFFNYVFASEEYNEYVNSEYNDVFAFLVDGVNIAKIGTEEVSINTVNCGNPFGGTGPNCDKFVNNDPSDGGPFHNVEYDGFTTKLTASVTGLAAGLHTMKIVIADRSDESYDSAVFIEASSFAGEPNNPPPSEVPEPGALGLLALGMAALGLNRRRRA